MIRSDSAKCHSLTRFHTIPFSTNFNLIAHSTIVCGEYNAQHDEHISVSESQDYFFVPNDLRNVLNGSGFVLYGYRYGYCVLFCVYFYIKSKSRHELWMNRCANEDENFRHVDAGPEPRRRINGCVSVCGALCVSTIQFAYLHDGLLPSVECVEVCTT